MVVRDEKTGRLALSCDKGRLEASMGLKHKSKTGWGDKGLSKTLFKGKFGLTDEMLRQAILDDEVQVKTQLFVGGVSKFCTVMAVLLRRHLPEENGDIYYKGLKLYSTP